jgi:hypothetical protein
MLESEVEWTVILRAKRRGWVTRKMKWIGRRNAPDHFLAKAGHGVILAEFKKPKNPADRITQDREIEALREAGVRVEKINTIEQGDAIFV